MVSEHCDAALSGMSSCSTLDIRVEMINLMLGNIPTKEALLLKRETCHGAGGKRMWTDYQKFLKKVRGIMWIDGCYMPGDVVFLVKMLRSGIERYIGRETPLRTNLSNKPELGSFAEPEWCGETDNVSKYACGMWRVQKLTVAGDRNLVTPIVGEELVVELEKVGYPELAE